MCTSAAIKSSASYVCLYLVARGSLPVSVATHLHRGEVCVSFFFFFFCVCVMQCEVTHRAAGKVCHGPSDTLVPTDWSLLAW